MKILVDKLPEKLEECPFAGFDFHTGHTCCDITRGEICDLAFDKPCGRLKTLEDAMEEKR